MTIAVTLAELGGVLSSIPGSTRATGGARSVELGIFESGAQAP